MSEEKKKNKIIYTNQCIENYVNNEDNESYEEENSFSNENYFENMLGSLQKKMMEYVNQLSLPICEYLSTKKIEMFLDKENISKNLSF